MHLFSYFYFGRDGLMERRKESRLRGVSYGRWDWGEMQKRNVQTAVKLMG
jgi:hypothetical protein